MKQVLSVQDVKKVYRVRKTKGNKQTKLNALDGISFCLNEGEALGIIGDILQKRNWLDLLHKTHMIHCARHIVWNEL